MAPLLYSNRPVSRYFNPLPAVMVLSRIFIGLAAAVLVYAGPQMYGYVQTWDKPFFPDAVYDPAVPAPDSGLGYPLGSKPANYEEIMRYLRQLAPSCPRVILKDCGKTFEDRRIPYVIISSESNIARLEDIKNAIAKLADPRLLKSDQEAGTIIDKTPAIAWLAYNIHGDELSSTDAALQCIYQLAAGTDPLTSRLREELVVIVVPTQNPDGRERAVAQMRQLNGEMMNDDVQSMQHEGIFPWGRGNHYWFDLNRNWITLSQPETRGQAQAILEWHPQLFVDAHEMGSFDTYLFSPPREPFNPNISNNMKKWWKIFSQEQARALDQYGWSYYTKDWHEGWYPGFGSFWSLFAGAIGILYEQAGVQGTAIKQPDGYLLTFRETVHHHFTSSMANITTAADHRHELLTDFYQEKKRSLASAAGDGYSAFILPASGDPLAIKRLIDVLLAHGIEVRRAGEPFSVAGVRDGWGKTIGRKNFPAGTYFLVVNQPMGRLAKALLEFDPRVSDSVLVEELKSLEKGTDTRFYEVTAWSVPLAFGLESYWSANLVHARSEIITELTAPAGQVKGKLPPRYAYVFDGAGEAAVSALIELLRNDYRVRISTKAFTVEGVRFSKGSAVLRINSNPEGIHEFVRTLAGEAGIDVYGVNTALCDEGSDLGTQGYVLLYRPRVAVLSGSGVDFTSFASIWYLLDHECHLSYSTLDINALFWIDLNQYNVLIIPPVWGGPEAGARYFSRGTAEKLKKWIGGGGTLIAWGSSAAFFADTSSGISAVRLRHQVLDKMGEFEEALKKERASNPAVDARLVWDNVAAGGDSRAPAAPEKKSPEALVKEDERAQLLMPRGCIMRVNLDPEHWLTTGLGEKVPAILYTNYAFVSKKPVETPARFADESDIRLSGLLWPEAKKRWAKTAFLTRESMGKGQIIMFADEPYFRAYFHGTKRLLLNAILLGPGCGTEHSVPW